MSAKLTVRLTANFEQNLEDIEAFLNEAEQSSAFDKLLTELSENVIPNLERFPALGMPMFDRSPGSLESTTGTERLRQKLHALDAEGELREYLMNDYLLLYARIRQFIYLLSIRHHRQLSFDFDALWRRSL